MIGKPRSTVLYSASIAFIATSIVSASAKVTAAPSAATPPPAVNEAVPVTANEIRESKERFTDDSAPLNWTANQFWQAGRCLPVLFASRFRPALQIADSWAVPMGVAFRVIG
jgi:hypothetical protein